MPICFDLTLGAGFGGLLGLTGGTGILGVFLAEPFFLGSTFSLPTAGAGLAGTLASCALATAAGSGCGGTED